MVARLKKDLDDLGLEAPYVLCSRIAFYVKLIKSLSYRIVGHAGDGNIHALILVDSAQERQKGKQAVYSMVNISLLPPNDNARSYTRQIKTAQALDGTCTGVYRADLSLIQCSFS